MFYEILDNFEKDFVENEKLFQETVVLFFSWKH